LNFPTNVREFKNTKSLTVVRDLKIIFKLFMKILSMKKTLNFFQYTGK